MRIAPILFRTGHAVCLLIAAISTGKAADEVVITSISPDGRYALRTHTEGDEVKSEAISLPKGDVDWGRIVELQGERPVRHLCWSPDSRRFAFSYPETQRFTVTEVFERAGESFRKVELPDADIPQEEPHRGAGWSFREKGDSVTPLRWLDSDTLLLRTWAYGYLNNKTTGETDSGDTEGLARLRFTKIGGAVVSKVIAHGKRPPTKTPALQRLAEEPRLRDLIAPDDAFLDAQWASDKSALLLVQGNSGGDSQAARLVEMRKGRLWRPTLLRYLPEIPRLPGTRPRRRVSRPCASPRTDASRLGHPLCLPVRHAPPNAESLQIFTSEDSQSHATRRC